MLVQVLDVEAQSKNSRINPSSGPSWVSEKRDKRFSSSAANVRNDSANPAMRDYQSEKTRPGSTHERYHCKAFPSKCEEAKSVWLAPSLMSFACKASSTQNAHSLNVCVSLLKAIGLLTCQEKFCSPCLTCDSTDVLPLVAFHNWKPMTAIARPIMSAGMKTTVESIARSNTTYETISSYQCNRPVADPGGGGARPPPPPVPAKKKKKKKKKRRRRRRKRKKSALGFVKSDHRSTMFEGRLNALLRLSVYKDIHLDFEEVVTTYGHKHPRRKLLGRPLDA